MKFLTFLASLILIQAVAFAQTSDTAVKNDGATPQIPQIDLLLNGIILDKELFEYRLQTAVQNGQEDSLELRLAIRDELYNRALLLEEAKTTGISKNKAVKLLVQETQENVYIDLLFQEYLKTLS